MQSLICPPRMRLPNYNPVSKDTMKNFSEFRKSFLSFDKTKIAFSLFKNIASSSKTKRCIIYTHSHGSCSDEGLQLLEISSKAEVSLCLYDSRGCGNSGDGYNTFGKHESIDLLYMLYYCAIIDGFTEFILWGRSIGTCAIIQLLSKLKLQEMKRINLRLTPEIKDWLNEFESISLREQLALFQELNNIIHTDEFEMKCIGAILDAPVKSVSASVENFVSKRFISLDFISKIASGMTQKWIKDKTKIDIYKGQNFTLAKKLTTTAVFLCSKRDEMIIFDDLMELYNGYGSTSGHAVIKNVLEIDVTHKQHRQIKDMTDALNTILEFGPTDKGNFNFTIKNVHLDNIYKSLEQNIRNPGNQKPSHAHFASVIATTTKLNPTGRQESETSDKRQNKLQPESKSGFVETLSRNTYQVVSTGTFGSELSQPRQSTRNVALQNLNNTNPVIKPDPMSSLINRNSNLNKSNLVSYNPTDSTKTSNVAYPINAYNPNLNNLYVQPSNNQQNNYIHQNQHPNQLHNLNGSIHEKSMHTLSEQKPMSISKKSSHSVIDLHVLENHQARPQNEKVMLTHDQGSWQAPPTSWMLPPRQRMTTMHEASSKMSGSQSSMMKMEQKSLASHNTQKPTANQLNGISNINALKSKFTNEKLVVGNIPKPNTTYFGSKIETQSRKTMLSKPSLAESIYTSLHSGHNRK